MQVFAGELSAEALRSKLEYLKAHENLQSVDDAIAFTERQMKEAEGNRQAGSGTDASLETAIKLLTSAVAAYSKGDIAASRAAAAKYKGGDDGGLRYYFDKLELRLKAN
jgi:hypothetical protein